MTETKVFNIIPGRCPALCALTPDGELSKAELFLLKSIRTAASKPCEDELGSALYTLIHFIDRNASKKLHIVDSDSASEMTDDEKLLFDIIGGCQCGFGCYCKALLKLFVQENNLNKARFLSAEVSNILSRQDLHVRHRLCSSACSKLQWLGEFHPNNTPTVRH